jgi:transposase InsO family protein
MSSLHQEFPSLSIRQLCTLLGVSRSWVYERAHASTQAERDIALRDAIERVVLEFPGYGYRRVTAELQRQQWMVNHKRLHSSLGYRPPVEHESLYNAVEKPPSAMVL